MRYRCWKGISYSLFSSSKFLMNLQADLRLSSEGGWWSMTASSKALATMAATNSVNISMSSTTSGCCCSLEISMSHTSDVSDSGYLDTMQCNQSAKLYPIGSFQLLRRSSKHSLLEKFCSFGDKQWRFNLDWLSRYSFIRYSKSQDSDVLAVLLAEWLWCFAKFTFVRVGCWLQKHNVIYILAFIQQHNVLKLSIV